MILVQNANASGASDYNNNNNNFICERNFHKEITSSIAAANKKPIRLGYTNILGLVL